MMARRLSTIEGKEEMEIKALRSAVRYFEIAESTSSERIRIKCSENIVHDREQIVRSHGDALSWLGKKDEARELFVRSGLWSLDPNCRSRHQHVEMPNLPYIMKEHAIISRLLPLLTFLRDVTDADTHLTNRMDIESRGWSSEMAGLHRGRRRWYMRFLFVNGKEHEPTYPILKNLVKHVPSLNLKQGQIKLSMMLPGTNVRPHAGPTNGRLRVHCLLHNDMKSHSYIRVGAFRFWKSGVLNAITINKKKIQVRKQNTGTIQRTHASCFGRVASMKFTSTQTQHRIESYSLQILRTLIFPPLNRTFPCSMTMSTYLLSVKSICSITMMATMNCNMIVVVSL